MSKISVSLINHTECSGNNTELPYTFTAYNEIAALKLKLTDSRTPLQKQLDELLVTAGASERQGGVVVAVRLRVQVDDGGGARCPRGHEPRPRSTHGASGAG